MQPEAKHALSHAHWLCALLCRYVYHTLLNSKHTVKTIDEADVVYVYDYCYMMWLLSDHHAREHWWLRDNYTPLREVGGHLLSAYRCTDHFISKPAASVH